MIDGPWLLAVRPTPAGFCFRQAVAVYCVAIAYSRERSVTNITPWAMVGVL